MFGGAHQTASSSSSSNVPQQQSNLLRHSHSQILTLFPPPVTSSSTLNVGLAQSPTTTTTTTLSGHDAAGPTAATVATTTATTSVARLKIPETARSVSLSIPAFSTLQRGQTISYGACPFLIQGRKWGLNVYPHGLRPHQKDYSQRIDIYLHIWAKDNTETEAQFLNWVEANKVHFTIEITEPAPVAMSHTCSSADTWSDIEDGAGWWLFSFKASSRLIDLTDDTLIVNISFQPGPAPSLPPSPTTSTITNTISTTTTTTAAIAGLMEHRKALLTGSSFGSMSSDDRSVSAYTTPFPSAADPSLIGLLNNKDLSDLRVIIPPAPYSSLQPRTIHLQRCIVTVKIPNWSTLHPPEQYSRPTVSMPQGTSHDTALAMFTFAYSGQLPSDLPCTPLAIGDLHNLAELYGLESLRRHCARQLYSLLTPANCIDVLVALGGSSAKLQEIVTIYSVQNWAEVVASEPFARLCDGVGRGGGRARRLLALLRRVDVHSNSNTASPGSSVSVETIGAESVRLDWRHSMAFRSLLSNPAVADVQFVVEGRTIYAQKSILSALSEFFLAMFSHTWAESTSSGGPTIIEIPDFPYATFHSMLLFLYVNEVDPPQTLTDTGLLFLIADKYQIPDLTQTAETFLRRQMTPQNVSEFLFGFAHAHDKLRSVAMDFLVANFRDVRACAGFWDVVVGCAGAGGSGGDEVNVLKEICARLVVKDFVRADVCIEELGEGSEGCGDVGVDAEDGDDGFGDDGSPDRSHGVDDDGDDDENDAEDGDGGDNTVEIKDKDSGGCAAADGGGEDDDTKTVTNPSPLQSAGITRATSLADSDTRSPEFPNIEIIDDAGSPSRSASPPPVGHACCSPPLFHAENIHRFKTAAGLQIVTAMASPNGLTPSEADSRDDMFFDPLDASVPVFVFQSVDGCEVALPFGSRDEVEEGAR